MKLMTKTKVCLYAAITALISGCSVYLGPDTAPPPPVAVVVYPDYYAWDGYEYVGMRGGQYVYLGGGGVWLVCDPVVLNRFRGWERYNPNWRRSAVRYVPGQHIARRAPDVAHRAPEVEHRAPVAEHKAPPAVPRAGDKKTPPPQIKKAAPQEKKAAPEKKEQ
jgi:hypothetical protein